jgi:hypothetical protein
MSKSKKNLNIYEGRMNTFHAYTRINTKNYIYIQVLVP